MLTKRSTTRSTKKTRTTTTETNSRESRTTETTRTTTMRTITTRPTTTKTTMMMTAKTKSIHFHIPSEENTVHENKTTSLCCGLWDRAGTAEAERDW